MGVRTSEVRSKEDTVRDLQYVTPVGVELKPKRCPVLFGSVSQSGHELSKQTPIPKGYILNFFNMKAASAEGLWLGRPENL